MKISNILLKNIRDFQTSLERMVTGLKINKPADDPAGFFVASRFNTQIKGLENANTNIQTALTMLKVADESMGEINDILNKMRDLIQKGCNGYMTPQERELHQQQINDLFARAVEIKNGTESNGIKIFDGGVTKLDKNKTYMDGQEVVVAGQVLTTTGSLLVDYTGTGEVIEPEVGTAWDRPEPTPESDEGEEVQGEEPAVMMMSRGASTFAMTRSVEAEDLGTWGSVGFAAGETKTVKVNGLTYTIENNNSSGVLNFSTDADGLITITSNNSYSGDLTITAADGQNDKLNLEFQDYTVNTGDGDDYIISNGGSSGSTVNSGSGNDTIILGNNGQTINAGDGDDAIDVGNYTGGIIDGGAGTDTVINGVGATSITNVENTGSSAGDTIILAVGETKTVTIVGKSYDIYNGSSTTGTVAYSVQDGVITFVGSSKNSLCLTAHSGQNDNIKVDGFNSVDTGDSDDIIIVEQGAEIWSAYAGDGNNTITVSGSVMSIAGQNGQDTVVVSETGVVGDSIRTGLGEDNITVSGTVNILSANGYKSTEFDQITVTDTGSVSRAEVGSGDYITLEAGASITVGEYMQYDVVNNTGSDASFGSKYQSGTTYFDSYSSGLHLAIYGKAGSDDICVQGDWHEINTGAGNDKITTLNSFNANIVSGGDGTDVLVNGNLNLSDSAFTNFENTILSLSAGASETVTIGGKTYTIIAGSSGGSISYAYDAENDRVWFDSYYTGVETASNFTITAANGQNDNILLMSGALTLNTGDGDDTVEVTGLGNLNTINLGSGNDTAINGGTLGSGGVLNTWDGGEGVDTYTTNKPAESKNAINFEAVEDLGTSGSREFAAGESKTVKINGMIYTITNEASSSQTLNFSTASDVIIFSNDNHSTFKIIAADGQADKIELGSYNMKLYTGDGDDTIIAEYCGLEIDAGAGDDYLATGTSCGTANMGAGNDTVVVNDYSWTIDGGDGNDIYTDNSGYSDSNTFTNFENDPSQPTTISIAAGETETVTIDGKKYDIFNGGTTSATVTYSLSEGQITFDGSSEYLSLIAHSGQEDNIAVTGKWIAVDTGDMDDNITASASIGFQYVGNETRGVYGGAGYDTITVAANTWTSYVHGGAGNDQIDLYGSVDSLWCDDGDDTVTLHSGSAVVGGGGKVVSGGNLDGDDTSTNDTVYNYISESVSRFENVVGNSGEVYIEEGKTVTIEVDGKKYDITNNDSTTRTVTYALNEGQITFDGDSSFLNLTAHEGQEDNLVFTGNWNNITTGDGADNITVAEGASTGAITTGTEDDIITIYGSVGAITTGDGADTVAVKNIGKVSGVSTGNGIDNILIEGCVAQDVSAGADDDTVTLSGSLGGSIYAGADNDIITVSSTGNIHWNAYGGAGDDTIVVDGTVSNAIWGDDESGSESGKDNITVNSNENSIHGGNDEDTITVNGNNNTVYGGSNEPQFGYIDNSTNDKAYNNGTGNTFNGVETIVGNSGTVEVKAGETVTVEIDGKKYDIYNRSDNTTQTVTYALNDGKITFDGSSDDLTLTAHENQEDNLNITGDWFGVYTGDMNDTVDVLENTYITSLGAGLGDDIINVYGNVDSMGTDEGADTININQTAKYAHIDGGADNDNITIAGQRWNGAYGYVYGGTGDDIITVTETGEAGAIYASDGNDNITVKGRVQSVVDGGGGQDVITVDGRVDDVLGGNGADTITINGSVDYDVRGLGGDDTIVVNQGASVHSVGGDEGDDNVTIAGTIYYASTGTGNDIITVTSTGVVTSYVEGNEGDDTITVERNASVGAVFGGNGSLVSDGNDTITINGHVGNSDTTSSGTIWGDAGNDTITIGEHANIIGGVFGGNGDDTIDISGKFDGTLSDYQHVQGGAGNDTVTLKSDGIIADGGDDTTGDTIYNYALNNTFTNFENIHSTAGTIEIAAGETATVEIDGKKYDIRNDSSSTGTVSYALAEDGIINFTGSSTEQSELYLLAHENQEDKVKVDGFSNIDLGNYDDTLIVDGTIYGATMGLGNDTVTVTEGSVVTQVIEGGDGDDTFTIAGAVTGPSGSVSGVYGNAGDDTITVTQTGSVTDLAGDDREENGPNGNDTIILSGSVGRITGEFGTDNIYVTETGWASYIDGSNDTIIVDGTVAHKIFDSGIDTNITVNGNVGEIETCCADGTTIIVNGTVDRISHNYGAQNSTITVNGTVNHEISTGSGTNTVTIAQNASVGGSIQGGSGVDNITVSGSVGGSISVGAGEDNISVLDTGYVGGPIYGGTGNDTLNISGKVDSSVYGDDGNDIIHVTGTGSVFGSYGNNGDDTIIMDGGAHNIFGDGYNGSQTGNDTITVNSDGNYVNAGNGDDTITLNSNNNYVYGGVYNHPSTDIDNSTNDTAYSYGTGNSFRGVENIYGNSGTVNVKAGETITVEIDGQKYDIYNRSDNTTQTVTYALNDGKITFDGSSKDDLILTAHSGQADNISVDGFREVYTMDGNDTIVVEEDSTIWSAYAGSGDNTIIVRGEADTIDGGSGKDNITVTETGRVGISIIGYGGNDTITIAGESGRITSGEGDDTITVTSKGVVNGNIFGGYHNDTIAVSGIVSGVMGDDGNDSITLTSSASVNVIKTGYGEDYLKVDANNTNIELGYGKNDVIINGSENMIVSSFGVSSGIDNNITINGDWNEVDFSSMDSGVDKVNINGNDNVVNTGGGDDNINIYGDNNTVDASAGDDLTSVVSGIQNMVFGGTGYDKVANYSSKTTYAEMDELINGGSNYRVQVNSNIDESSGYNMDLSMSLPSDAVFDISSVENAQNSLLQIDELIGQLTKQRGQISFQNTMLNEILESNLTRLTNLNNSLSTVRDADTAAEYNNLLAKASLIEQGQLLQAQLLESNASVVTQLIGGIAS